MKSRQIFRQNEKVTSAIVLLQHTCFTDAGVVALCVETAPCGELAGRLLSEVGVRIPEDRITRGQDVKATLAAVTEGDAHAAIVYVTDAAAAGDRAPTVELPPTEAAVAERLVAEYPIAVVWGASSELAVAFVEHVRSEAGQRVLRDAGFLP